MKFSTDVLLIAPAVMGAIFSISRIWDAISDPIAGYLSDRTTFKFGRRRTWMLISFVPIAFGFLAVFSPPENLQGQSLDLWMMIAILSFYSAITLFNVPHMALGAELSEDYHERTRLFGVRHIGFTLGSILSLVSMSLLISEESSPTGDVRELASNLALFAVLAMARTAKRAKLLANSLTSPVGLLSSLINKLIETKDKIDPKVKPMCLTPKSLVLS